MSLFVSYSTDDATIVDRICNLLAAHQVKAWKDRWRLHPGEALTESITRSIEQASYFCVVLSSYSLQSEWVHKELQIALRLVRAGRPLVVIPIVIDDSPIPEALRDLVYVDLRTDFDVGMGRLIGLVGQKYNVNLKGRLEDGRDYWFDFLVSQGEQDGRLFLDIDMVAYDGEAQYSIIAQLNAVGTEHATRSTLDVAHTHGVAAVVVPLLADRYSGTETIRIVSGDAVYEDRCQLFLDPARIAFNVSLRIVRLGRTPRNVVLFPLGRYLQQIVQDCRLG